MSKIRFQDLEKKLFCSNDASDEKSLSNSEHQSLTKIDTKEILSLLEKNEAIDGLVSRILDERLSLEKNKFKVAAVAIVLKRLERVKKLLEALELVEEEIFGNRLSKMSNPALVNLYREMNQNIRYMVELLSHFDEHAELRNGLQVNLVQQLNTSADISSASQKVESNVEINALEAIRRLGEILSVQAKEIEEKENQLKEFDDKQKEFKK